MPWECRLVTIDERKATPRIAGPDGNRLPAGLMWFEDIDSSGLSAFYHEHNADRLPIMLVLPCGCWFLVDSRATGSDSGWAVTGTPPNLTMTPSINCLSHPSGVGWHGYLTNGILTDDVEGRSHPSAGGEPPAAG